MKKTVVLTGLLGAMTLLTTAYVLHIPVGTGGGYVHLGDTVVYLAAALLPTPYAMVAAAVGAALADLFTGAAVWALPTAVIKAVMVLPFTAHKDRLFCLRNGIAPVIAGVSGVSGYFLAETGIVMLSGGTWQAALGGAALAVLPNLLQELAGGVCFVLLALALDRLQIKKRLK